MLKKSIKDSLNKLQNLSGLVKDKVDSQLTWLGSIWAKVRLFLGVLNLIRFNLLIVVVSFIAVTCVTQVQEALIILDDNSWQLILFIISALVCGFCVWYTSRIMFLFKFKNNKASHAESFPEFKEHFPRLLGASILAVTIWGLLESQLENVAYFVIYLFIVLIAFLVLVYKRREIKALKLEKLKDVEKDLQQYSQLPAVTKIIIKTAFLINVIFLLAVIHYPVAVGNFAGSLSLLYFGSSLLVFTGGIAVYWANHQSFPLMVALLLIVVISSYFNDNHWVRQYASMDSTGPAKSIVRQNAGKFEHTLESYFENWINKFSDSDKSQPLPLVLVSAEGGGIRAAYWTAAVLTELQDRYPDFHRYVFAISGVSGGSLGGTVYTALLPDTNNRPVNLNIQGNSYRNIAKKVLKQDFLSPVVATMLFPDLLQRFIPVPFLNDRAITMEKAWENAWQNVLSENPGLHAKKARFKEPYYDLYKHNPTLPLLFLNSTVVESGQRLILNPLKFTDQSEFQKTFKQALDARNVMGRTDMPLSTAVHLSSRFTYVSPAGTIERRDYECKQPTFWQKVFKFFKNLRGKSEKSNFIECDAKAKWIRAVDGGYFENSGTVTLQEILTALINLQSKLSINNEEIKIKPIVIHISNDPLKEGEEIEYKYKGKRKLLSGLLSPVLALLNVRPARGYQARGYLEELSRTFLNSSASNTEANFFHFSLQKNPEIDLPLGWALSKRSMYEMDRQLPPGTTTKDRLGNASKNENPAANLKFEATDKRMQDVAKKNAEKLQNIISLLPDKLKNSAKNDSY